MAKVAHTIREAKTDDEIKALFPVYNELDSHLHSPEELLRMIRIMKSEAPVHFLYIKDTLEGETVPRVVSLLTYRIQHCLFYYKQLFIFDLCTLSTAKKRGYASTLLDKVKEIAIQEKCNVVNPDSGYNRTHAHRLYHNKGYTMKAHHFTLDINPMDKNDCEWL